jgi:hypothetical protein
MGIFSRIFKKDEAPSEEAKPTPMEPPVYPGSAPAPPPKAPPQRVPEHALPAVVVELPGVTVEDVLPAVDVDVEPPSREPPAHAPQFPGFGSYVSTRMVAAAPAVTPGPPPALATPPPMPVPRSPTPAPPPAPSSPPPIPRAQALPPDPPHSSPPPAPVMGQPPPPPPPAQRRESAAMRSTPPLPPPTGRRHDITARMPAAAGAGTAGSTLPAPRRHTPTDPIPATRADAPVTSTPSAPPAAKPSREPAASMSDDSTQPQKLTKVPSAAPSRPPADAPRPQEPPTVARVLAEARSKMAPVRDFMIDVEAGEASRDWIAVAKERLEELREGLTPFAETQPLRDGIDAMLGALAALPRQGRTLERASCMRVIEAFGMLAGRSPDVFATAAERRARERIIVEATLELGKCVSPICIERLLRGGFDTLRAFFDATPDRIAEVGGVPRSVAEQLVAALERHRRDAAAVQVDRMRSIDKMRIAGMVSDLREQTAAYERAAAKWSKEASTEKKTIAQARKDTLLRIKVGLARLGEHALLESVERLPFERKIEHLERYVADEGW